MLSKHQQRAMHILAETFGDSVFTFRECVGLALRRPEFTLETLHKKGVLTRKVNPNRSGVLSWDFWLYQLSAQQAGAADLLPLCTCGMGDATKPELHAQSCAIIAGG